VSKLRQTQRLQQTQQPPKLQQMPLPPKQQQTPQLQQPHKRKRKKA
jgi:hypothetical protein